ncbi:MAG: nodulation protein NfeD [Steroidobacteraceae bacterium]
MLNVTLIPQRIAPAAVTVFLALVLAAAGGLCARERARAADLPAAASAARSTSAVAALLEINGAIGPATSHYVVRGLQAARDRGARLVILEIDTPGGLDSAMRDIIRAILASPVAVVGYVSPPGARAASAGTYILYACHVAAMAPATNLGAATPVAIGGESPSAPVPAPLSKPAGDASGSPAATDKPAPPGEPSTPMERKVVNDAVAYIRGLAELRGRNADWAESAVRGAASLSADAALRDKVIDIVARDLPELLVRLDGREVRIGAAAVQLASRDLVVVREKPDWRTQLLAVIANPTVAYGLMLIGIWGLLLEGYNPGAVLPGVVGSICLLVALFAFQILSVNYAGLALVAVGTGMIVAEFFFPAYGSLGVGGLVAFVVGSLILFDTDVPGMNVARSLIAGVATAGGLIIGGIVYLASRSRGQPVATGTQAMIGASAEVLDDFIGKGRVRYGGELWNARSDAPLHAGDAARIVKVEGLTLWVEPR